MNVDAVLAPAGDRRGCFEPVDGEVYATSTERAVPARAKARGKAWGEGAGEGAGEGRGSDGPHRATARAALGGRLTDRDAGEEPDPVIAAAVRSPSGRADDPGRKPTRRFRPAGVRRALIVDPGKRALLHHRRARRGLIETRIAIEGRLDRIPPRLSLPVTGLFADPPAVGDGA